MTMADPDLTPEALKRLCERLLALRVSEIVEERIGGMVYVKTKPMCPQECTEAAAAIVGLIAINADSTTGIVATTPQPIETGANRDSRFHFEEWMRAAHPNFNLHRSRLDEYSYTNTFTKGAWAAWASLLPGGDR